MKLRNLEYRDIPLIQEWMKDESVNKFFRFDAQKISEDSIREYIKDALESDSDRHFAIADDNDEYMGTVSLKGIDSQSAHAEYAISLRKCAQGRGFGRYATIEILRYGFDKLNLNKVYLNVLSYNVRAIEFYEKIGFGYDGEFREHVYKDGQLFDIKWYSYMRKDFPDDI